MPFLPLQTCEGRSHGDPERYDTPRLPEKSFVSQLAGTRGGTPVLDQSDTCETRGGAFTSATLISRLATRRPLLGSTPSGKTRRGPVPESSCAIGPRPCSRHARYPEPKRRCPSWAWGPRSPCSRSRPRGRSQQALLAAVIRMLLEYGGRVVDTSPRTQLMPEIDAEFGEVLAAPEFSGRLFIVLGTSVRKNVDNVVPGGRSARRGAVDAVCNDLHGGLRSGGLAG